MGITFRKRSSRSFNELMVSAAVVLLIGLASVTDAQARRGHGYHHRHGPSINIIRGVVYPPYPYYGGLAFYRPVPRQAVVVQPVPEAASANQHLFVYPQRGQSAEVQRQDEYECYRWAATQSGFDPVSPANGSSTAVIAHSPPSDGLPDDPVSGTLGGAALGAAGGALAGDPATGAAVGAAVGLVAGLMGGANQARVTTAPVIQSTSQQNYRRAFSTCLGARGYEVG